MENRITFAVVGCGRIGVRHIETILNHNQAHLVATVDPKGAPNASEEQPETVPHFDSLEAFLAAGIHADVVNIATPNGCHAAQAISLLEAGYHVLIEKPLALTKSDAEKVLHTALSKGKRVFAVMQNRYSPPSEWLKSLVQSGALGDIYQVHLNCFWNRDERYYKPGGWHGTRDMDGGTLFTQFSHFVDILYWVFGDIHPIFAELDNFNHADSIDFEDSGSVVFRLERGGMGTLNYSTSVWDANLESSLTVIAEKGSLKIAGQYMNEVVHCHVENYTMPALLPSNPPNDYGGYKGSAFNHPFVIQNCIDVLRGNASIGTNALEGMKVVDIIERIYQLSSFSK
jgi:predicted dehydrogenase